MRGIFSRREPARPPSGRLVPAPRIAARGGVLGFCDDCGRRVFANRPAISYGRPCSTCGQALTLAEPWRQLR